MTGTRWHSWHLHIDSLDPAALDRLLVADVGPLVESYSRPWFFVRYWQGGPHLRLRIADLAADQVDAVQRRLDPAVAAVHATIPRGARLDADAYRRAVAGIAAAGEGGATLDAGRLAPCGAHRRVYEPEYHRYGGSGLMPLSEELFHASSTVALRICRTGRGGRVGTGLAALAAACSVLAEGSGAGSKRWRFLEWTRDEWTRWLVAAGTAVDAQGVDRAAGDLADRLAPAAPALLRMMRDGGGETWSHWREPLAAAVEIWRASMSPPAVIGIFGSHVHMMQNRLGVGAGREALLAATLLRLSASAENR
jgi:thiopeptide-type bacteriocin biosynthesis protein